MVSRSWTNRRKYFFRQSVITLWNSLLQDAMEAESINELQMGSDKFMDSPPSKAVKQKDVGLISDSGNLSAKIAGNLQGYFEEGGQRILSPCERDHFHSRFSPCTFCKQLKLDCLRHRILNNPLAWPILTLYNSDFSSFLLSLYLPLFFMTKPLDELNLSVAQLLSDQTSQPFLTSGAVGHFTSALS